MPAVFGLHAFDRREPVVRVLPGDFSNTVLVLVSDATATGRISRRYDWKSIEYTGLPYQAGIGTGHNLAEKTLAVLSVYGHA